MKLPELFFKYIVCDNDRERQDVFALCERLGLEPYSMVIKDAAFEIAKDVLVNGLGRTYQPGTKSLYDELNMPAKEFIDTYFN